jgi:hypothetical protein
LNSSTVEWKRLNLKAVGKIMKTKRIRKKKMRKRKKKILPTKWMKKKTKCQTECVTLR